MLKNEFSKDLSDASNVEKVLFVAVRHDLLEFRAIERLINANDVILDSRQRSALLNV